MSLGARSVTRADACKASFAPMNSILMKWTLAHGVALVLLMLAVVPVRAQTAYYVAPDGDDDNPGTIAEPRASVTVAQVYAAPGDTIYMRGGTYAFEDPERLVADGEEGARLHLWAYPGEMPVLDFADYRDGEARALRITGSYWHLKGLVVQNAGDNGIHISGDDNVIEQVVVRYNRDSGLQLDSGASRNLILNVDSYENYDPQNNGENADGFAPKFDVGPGNVLRGCRAYRNSDDGFDMWNEDVANGNGVRVEDSWAFENGVNRWDDPAFDGDGNGFKLGHGTGAHELVRVLTWRNAKHGIDINGNQTGVTVYNSTGFDNGGDNFYFDEMSDVHVLRNNVSHDADVTIFPDIDDAFNTWNEGFAATDADFVSLDPAGLDGPRREDGSLPETGFMHLVAGSSLVNAGTDVGLPYAGAAPDLGAFETNVGVAVEEAENPTPGVVRLLPGYPNPFHASTRLTFELHEAAPVRIAVYDALGRHVATVLDAMLPSGRHAVRWHADGGLPNGIYFARLETTTALAVQRVVLAR